LISIKFPTNFEKINSMHNDPILDALDAQLNKKVYSFETIADASLDIYKALTDASLSPQLKKEQLVYLYADLLEVMSGERIKSADYVPSKKLYPSTLMSDCLRRIWLEHNDVPMSDPENTFINPQLQRIFDVGNFWHGYIQTKLLKAKILIKSEFPVKDENLIISGRCDGLIKLGRHERVLEIKTISGAGYYALTEPREKDVFQANLYAGILGIKKITIVFLNKDSGDIRSFNVDFDKQQFDETVALIERIKEEIKAPMPPKPDCKNRHTQNAGKCQWCTVCFDTWETQKELLVKKIK